MRVDPQLAPALDERARRLAQPLAGDEALAPADGLLCFNVGSEAFAIRSDAMAGVHPARRPAPIPHGPDWLAGMVGVRGRVVPAIWLDRFFSARAGASELPPERVVVVQVDRVQLALLATTIEGIRSAPGAALEPLPGGLAPSTVACAAGIHAGHLVIDPSRFVRAIGAALGSAAPDVGEPAPHEVTHGDLNHAPRT